MRHHQSYLCLSPEKLYLQVLLTAKYCFLGGPVQIFVVIMLGTADIDQQVQHRHLIIRVGGDGIVLQQHLADGECRILVLHVKRLGEDAGTEELLVVLVDVAKEHSRVQQHQCSLRIGGKCHEDGVFLIGRVPQILDMLHALSTTAATGNHQCGA